MEIYVRNLVLEVTRRCNMCCDHCLRGDAQNLDITNEILEMVAKKINPGSITITGGEPSLNISAIQRYFELAEKYGTMPDFFYVVTNGKANQKELALTLLLTYSKMSEDELCGLTVSIDPFHEDFSKDAEIFRGLSFFSESDKTHDPGDFNWLLDTGRASENGIGVCPPRPVADSLKSIVESTWTHNGESVVEIDMLYVAANGNIIDDCDQTFADVDKLAFCNILNLETKLQEILQAKDNAA